MRIGAICPLYPSNLGEGAVITSVLDRTRDHMIARVYLKYSVFGKEEGKEMWDIMQGYNQMYQNPTPKPRRCSPYAPVSFKHNTHTRKMCTVSTGMTRAKASSHLLANIGPKQTVDMKEVWKIRILLSAPKQPLDRVQTRPCSTSIGGGAGRRCGNIAYRFSVPQYVSQLRRGGRSCFVGQESVQVCQRVGWTTWRRA